MAGRWLVDGTYVLTLVLGVDELEFTRVELPESYP